MNITESNELLFKFRISADIKPAPNRILQSKMLNSRRPSPHFIVKQLSLTISRLKVKHIFIQVLNDVKHTKFARHTGRHPVRKYIHQYSAKDGKRVTEVILSSKINHVLI